MLPWKMFILLWYISCHLWQSGYARGKIFTFYILFFPTRPSVHPSVHTYLRVPFANIPRQYRNLIWFWSLESSKVRIEKAPSEYFEICICHQKIIPETNSKTQKLFTHFNCYLIALLLHGMAYLNFPEQSCIIAEWVSN